MPTTRCFATPRRMVWSISTGQSMVRSHDCKDKRALPPVNLYPVSELLLRPALLGLLAQYWYISTRSSFLLLV
ncbi:hypothetical protein BDF14DRAFT_1861889 [Spinellus fusiger]|nr:hypothetical protein BDF14DRAFT_1861889 [Spinellus fusiger]